MSFPAIAQTEGYWDAMRGGAAIPMRSEIDPRALRDVLDYAFLLERIAPGVGRFCIAGMHLSDLMGMEVRGMPTSAMFMPPARQEFSEIVEYVCEQPSIVELSLKGDRGLGRSKLEAKMLMAPLKSDFGDVNRILGCLQSLGPIGRQPRRFTISDVHIRDLGLAAKTPANSTCHAVAHGFAEPSEVFAPFAEPKKSDKSGPALRLVVDNGLVL